MKLIAKSLSERLIESALAKNRFLRSVRLNKARLPTSDQLTFNHSQSKLNFPSATPLREYLGCLGNRNMCISFGHTFGRNRDANIVPYWKSAIYSSRLGRFAIFRFPVRHARAKWQYKSKMLMEADAYWINACVT